MIGKRSRLAVLLLLAGCAGGQERAAKPSADGPSLLLLTLDTTRADRLEPYGAEAAETPNLAALAAAGAVFERAFAVTPVTLPSHATIFSGVDPLQHGVRNNGVPLPAGEQTLLAEILRGRGLRTAAFVSAAVLDRRFGLQRGFERYDDDLSAGRPRAARLIAERPAAATVAGARAWLDGLDAGQRFFLWVHLFDPHAAYTPPAPFAERFRERPYDGEIAAMDREVGLLLEHPRLAADRLVVMAIGDHGESLGDHGEDTHAMLAYDSTLRVPWIVRAPGVGAGRRIESPVSQVDLLPTALDLLAIAPPSGLAVSGISLAPALRGGGEPTQERPIYGETLVPYLTYGWAPLHTLRRGRWKLVRGSASELFDLAADPGEQRDVAAAEATTTVRLERELTGLLAAAVPVAEESSGDREMTERLRSLGYLSTGGSAAERLHRPDPRAFIATHLAFERAAGLFYRHELDQAIPALQAVIDRDPENLAALTMLAKALSERQLHDQARTLARRAVELAPTDPGARIALGLVQARSGPLDLALATLLEASRLDPASLDARLEVALLLFRLDRVGEGAETLQQVLAQDATNPRALIALAEQVDLPAGRRAEAERRLRDVLARDPSRVEGWRALGRLLDRDGRGEEAVEVFRLGLSQAPGDGQLYADLGMTLGRLGRPAEAEASLRQAKEQLRPGSAAVHNALAGLHLRRGEWAVAESEARRAVELDPSTAAGWSNLGAALEERGEPTAALAAYDRALAADAGFWQAEFNRALLLRLGGRYDEAAAGFRAVLESVPGHAKSHFELGVLYLGPLGDRGAAQRHLTAAIEAEPDHPRAAEARRLLAR